MSVTKVKLGTRKSRLALWQTNHVMALLQNAWPSLKCETVPFVTRGDRTLDTPLPVIGGKGLFTQELEEALLHGDIDIAVHSLKDLPVRNPDGLTVGAIPRRGDVRDPGVNTVGLKKRGDRLTATLHKDTVDIMTEQLPENVCDIQTASPSAFGTYH